MLPDPYELNTVMVKVSKMKGGGEGLFAKVDLPAHQVVAFYNGIKEELDEDDVSSILEFLQEFDTNQGRLLTFRVDYRRMTKMIGKQMLTR